MNLNEFKQLSTKKKIGWIVDYYGTTIAATIVIIIVLVSLVISMLGLRADQQLSLSVLILDDRMTREISDNVKEEFSSVIDGNIEISFYSKSNTEQFRAFVVKTTYDGPDIVIAPYAEMSELAENGYVEKDYKKISDDSIYMEWLGPQVEGAIYEDEYIAVTTGGENLTNARGILERFNFDE